MGRDGCVPDEGHLALRREEPDLDVVFRRVRGQDEGHFLVDLPRDAVHLIVRQLLRIEHDGGRVAAEEVAREGIDEEQAARALGHGAMDPGLGEAH